VGFGAAPSLAAALGIAGKHVDLARHVAAGVIFFYKRLRVGQFGTNR
jgi:hypothetical protein